MPAPNARRLLAVLGVRSDLSDCLALLALSFSQPQLSPPFPLTRPTVLLKARSEMRTHVSVEMLRYWGDCIMVRVS